MCAFRAGLQSMCNEILEAAAWDMQRPGMQSKCFSTFNWAGSLQDVSTLTARRELSSAVACVTTDLHAHGHPASHICGRIRRKTGDWRTLGHVVMQIGC